MAKLLDVVEGWTEELEAFTLKANGVAVSLAGMDVDMILKTRSGEEVTVAGTTRVDDDPTTGKVYFKPGVGDLLNAQSPYSIRWKVTDGAGDAVFFPNAAADTIVVFKT